MLVFAIFTLAIILEIFHTQRVGVSRVVAAEEQSWIKKILDIFFISPVRQNGKEQEKHQFQIWLMTVDKKERHKLREEEEGVYRSPIFSPDGRKIAYIYDSALWLMDADGSSAQLVLDEPPVERIVAWSRESSGELALLSDEGTRLWSLTLSDKQLKPIERMEPEAFAKAWFNPRISPSGDEVRDFYYADEEDWAIQIRKKGGLFWTTLTEAKKQEKHYIHRDPSWSPDGRIIIFVSDQPY
jgi:dipeptidyl aminopeptidase/acylaminoacyl peptidase